MSDERILEALRAVTDEDRGLQAPAEVERRVTRGFRAHFSRRRRALGWAVAAALAAGIVLATVMVTRLKPTQAPPRSPERIDARAQPPALSAAKPAPAPAAEKKVRRVSRAAAGTGPARGAGLARQAKAERERIAAQVPAAAEDADAVTEFYPLVDPAPPFGRGQLLRVRLPASAMRLVGLPVREDRLAEPVQADILIGEEGMARAIRFARFEEQ
jgi:hypothetical protein